MSKMKLKHKPNREQIKTQTETMTVLILHMGSFFFYFSIISYFILHYSEVKTGFHRYLFQTKAKRHLKHFWVSAHWV